MGASEEPVGGQGRQRDPDFEGPENEGTRLGVGFQTQPPILQPPQPMPMMTSQQQQSSSDHHFSRLDRLNPSNPLRLAMAKNAAHPPSSRPHPPKPHPQQHPPPPSRAIPNPNPNPNSNPIPIARPPPILSQPPPFPTAVVPPHHQQQQPQPQPQPQQQQPQPLPPPPPVITLNSRSYTNKFSLFLFLLHTLISVGLVGVLIVTGTYGFISGGRAKHKEMKFLKHFLPQVEAASFLSITLALCWQKAIRVWPKFMAHFILWSSFSSSLSAAILLICFQTPSTNGVGAALLLFAVGNGLYACWVTQRIPFCTRVLVKSLEPVAKFHDLNRPTYWMLAAGFLWMSLWILAVIGALNFYFPPLVITALVLSLMWTAEVMRNVANLTVSGVVALYYLRGMEASTRFCFQRAMTKNLGSACLGSLFVPTIEALRIVARGLNLLEGEDEFMFSCAHCCLRLMGHIFRYGNSWAYVQIASYGKSFVKASQDTWALFERHEDMEAIVDSDITTSLCFLSGICSGSICMITVAAWTYKVHPGFTATISLLAFFVGYLMTRISMALPHACVSCYYVCYAENPQNRLFDRTIEDRIELIKAGRDVVVPTPRVPHRFTK